MMVKRLKSYMQALWLRIEVKGNDTYLVDSEHPPRKNKYFLMERHLCLRIRQIGILEADRICEEFT